MYGFDPDLDFSVLTGCEVTQICVDQRSVIYNLHPSGMIASRSGAWWLLDGEGNSIDKNIDFIAREVFRIHSLLGQKIVSCMVTSPETLQIHFSSGFTLELTDDSDCFESHELVIGGEIIPV